MVFGARALVCLAYWFLHGCSLEVASVCMFLIGGNWFVVYQC